MDASKPPPAYSSANPPAYPPGGAPPQVVGPQQPGYPPGAYPQGGAYPPGQGQYYAQPGAPPAQGAQNPQSVVVVQQGAGSCGHCGVGVKTENYTTCGIVLAILFFPLGILCCLLMKDRKCSHCGHPM